MNCPVCGHDGRSIGAVDFNKTCEDHKGERVFQPAGRVVRYERCVGCLFAWAPELYRWRPEEFKERIYNDEYPRADPDCAGARADANARTLLSMMPKLRGRHLDYGGGNGELSRLLREAGWDSTSYDPMYGETPPPGAFELVTAFEVFEHVPDPHATVRAILTAHLPAVVLFSTLLSDGLMPELSPLSWWYASPRNGHISLHSERSLAVLASAYGWKVVHLTPGFHMLWDPANPDAARRLMGVAHA